ncbi:hypothetical protein AB1Y20_018492 [Prymnesium parvum]|uniref:Uncharacterized protein n=1 Tax=Prymnesium parvum TaxID=97485 RepID=A0AB34JQ29_PRYPA
MTPAADKRSAGASMALSPPSAPPSLLSCEDGSGKHCTTVWISTIMSTCYLEANQTCSLANNQGDDTSGDGGLMWGIFLSLAGDVIISIGLALQKVAHNIIKKIEANNEKPPEYTKIKTWWLGILLTIGGEIGNFVAYGDENTPASVVTAVGCVGVVANLAIATTFLGEPYRKRDVIGASLVVCGVLLVVFMAPSQETKLTAERFYWLLAQPPAIVMYVVYAGLMGFLFYICPRYGHTHVIFYLALSSLIGSFTVMASKAVSTFVNLSIRGILEGPFWDQIGGQTNNESCINDGHSWYPISSEDPDLFGCVLVNPPWSAKNESGVIIAEGLQQLTEPGLYLSLIVMIFTAVMQVKYLNKGMQLFGNSEVIPCHYVCFTLSSIVGTSLMYQEFSVKSIGVCKQYIDLHLFGDGCFLTFLGVYLITSGRTKAELEAVNEDVEYVKNEESGARGEESDWTANSESNFSPPKPISPSLVTETIAEEATTPRKKSSEQLLQQGNMSASRKPSVYRSPSSEATRANERTAPPADEPRDEEFVRRPSILGRLAEPLRVEISGTGIGETRAERISSVVSLIGSALGGVHGATFMFDATEHETEDELDRQANLRQSFARGNSNSSFNLQRARPVSVSYPARRRPSSSGPERSRGVSACVANAPAAPPPSLANAASNVEHV